MRAATIGAFIVLSTAALTAHVTVQPKESAAGAVQTYTVRVPTETPVSTVAVELEVPAGLVVTDVPAGAAYKVDTRRAGGRIVAITWTQEIKAKESAQFQFSATNPAQAGELKWTAHQKLADGATIDWAGVEGDRRPASVTRITAAVNRP